MRKRLLLVIILLGLAWCLTACHTVHGAGEDIEDAGQGIQNASD